MNGRKTVWMNFPLNCVNRARSVCYIETLKARGRIVFILEKWNWMTPQRIHAIHPWVCVVRLCTEMLVSFVRASLSRSLSLSLFLPQHNSLNRVSCDFRWLSMHSDAIHCLVVVVVLLILYPFCCFTVRTLYEWNIYDLFFSCCFLLLLSPLVFNSFIRSRALKLSIILMNEIIIEWLKATTALSNCKW